jgi:nickel-dependent lactate racemase
MTQPGEALGQMMDAPLGQITSFGEQMKVGDRVCIIVSDSFRKTGIHLVLPALLDRLRVAGIHDADIAFVYATGTHRGPTREEEAEILGPEILERFRGQTHSHDAHDAANLNFLGETSRGTPVWMNRVVCEADHVIVTGSVVFHYFGGFGGGRKAVLPGVAGVDTIARNHAMNLSPHEDTLDPSVRIGGLTGNPVAEDMLEGAKLLPTSLLINTVLNRQGEIAGLFVGDLEAAHDEACAFARKLYAVPIQEQADLVIASAGAAKNYIQSHKALYNAYQALKPGGRIIFLSPAPEGYGGNKFQQWVDLGTTEAVIQALRKNAEINGQTALSTLQKAPSALFVTEMSAEDVERLGGRKAPSLQAAVDMALEELTQAGISTPTAYVMPSAGYAVPILKD